MAKKKRQRKTQQHHRGNPPPSVLEQHHPAYLTLSGVDPWDEPGMDDPGWDDRDLFGDATAYDADLRVLERPLLNPDPTGETTQAPSYFVADIVSWLRTPNAIEWVRKHADDKALRRHRTRQPTARLFRWS